MTDTRLRGIDVSKWQGAIDWPLVATDEFVTFAYVRASHGVIADPSGRTNLAGARLAGLRVGGYHYLEQHSDPAEQARAFAAELGADVAALPARMLPMLDVEEGGRDTPARALAFLEAFQAATGIWCGVYTFPAFAASVGLERQHELALGPLWVADWRGRAVPEVPTPWTSWCLWQYTNRLRVPGIRGPVDGIVAAGELPEAGASGPVQVAPGPLAT